LSEAGATIHTPLVLSKAPNESMTPDVPRTEAVAAVLLNRLALRDGLS